MASLRLHQGELGHLCLELGYSWDRILHGRAHIDKSIGILVLGGVFADTNYYLILTRPNCQTPIRMSLDSFDVEDFFFFVFQILFFNIALPLHRNQDRHFCVYDATQGQFCVVRNFPDDPQYKPGNKHHTTP